MKMLCFYAMVHQNHKDFDLIKQNSIKLSRQGLEGELIFTKTAVNFISSPYMDECQHYGEFNRIHSLAPKKLTRKLQLEKVIIIYHMLD